MTCVVVTRAGAGDFWRFDSAKTAGLHPIPQLGDAYCSSADDVIDSFRLSEFPALAERLGDPSLGRSVRFACDAGSMTRADKKMFAERMWNQMIRMSQEPPASSEEVVSVICKDRLFVAQRVNIYRPEPGRQQKQESSMNEEAVARPAGRTKKFADTSVISFGSDKEGKPYGAENNPKRAGSAAHTRFALYQSGMTVEQAIAAGVTRADINWDAGQGFIVLQ